MVREDIVNAGAAGAILSPWWLPPLHDASTIAAEVAPILGVLWLILQIVVKIMDAYRKWKFKSELQTWLQKSNKSNGGSSRFN